MAEVAIGKKKKKWEKKESNPQLLNSEVQIIRVWIRVLGLGSPI